MAYTFLAAVNLVAKRMGLVAGDATVFTSFTDSARQRQLDNILQVWNEGIRYVFSFGQFASKTAAGTITIVTDTREYDLPSDFEQMAGDSWHARVLLQPDTRLIVYEYPGGYGAMIASQPNPADWQGYANYWAINSSNGKIRLDRTPQTSQNGLVYNFTYEKRISLTATTDTFPFSDSVVDSLVAPVTEIARAVNNGQALEPGWADAQFSQAMRFISRTGMRAQYGTYRPQTPAGYTYRGPFEA